MPQMHPMYWLAMLLMVWGLMFVVGVSMSGSNMLSSGFSERGSKIPTVTELWVLISTM